MKLPEWTIFIDRLVLAVLYVEDLSETEQAAIAGVLAMQQNVHHSRISFRQEESNLGLRHEGPTEV